jgi:hypothetical protein
VTASQLYVVSIACSLTRGESNRSVHSHPKNIIHKAQNFLQIHYVLRNSVKHRFWQDCKSTQQPSTIHKVSITDYTACVHRHLPSSTPTYQPQLDSQPLTRFNLVCMFSLPFCLHSLLLTSEKLVIMARSVARKAGTAKTKMPVSGEGDSSLTMQYYVDGTFSDTPPKPKYHTDTTAQGVPGHQSEECTG